jgi:hypothetical protein
MANALGIDDDENVVYADDTTIRQAGRTVEEVVDKLTRKAARFAEWLRGSGLTMNASKTQLMLTSNAGSYKLGEPDTRPGNGGGRPGNGGGRPGNGGGRLGKGSGRQGKGKGDDHVSVMVDGKKVKAEDTWNCRHSSDGGNGAKNFVGAIIFDAGEATKKTTRAASAGLSTVPLRGKDTFMSIRARMWNASEALL